MKLKHRSLLLCFFLLLACHNNREENLSAQYQEKANELIAQMITVNEECSCIIEPEKNKTLLQTLSEESKSDHTKMVADALLLKKDSLFTKLNNLSNAYKIDENLNSQKHLVIKHKDFQNTLKTYNRDNWMHFMLKKCPKGWMSYSPPVFNATFDKAVIAVNSVISGQLIVVHYENGKWVRKKVLMNWIS